MAATAEFRFAAEWFRRNEQLLARWQQEVTGIAAPPFGEQARSEWLARRFADLGLDSIERDELGNVFAFSPGVGRRCICVSAHLDTVFPAGTPLTVKREGSRLYGPGISDNSSGITALLALAAVLRQVDLPHTMPFLFVGNVGEEGEGDLRGMRHIFSTPRWSDAIAFSLVLDGAGCDTIVAQALGSRRFEITVRGPGGHSWSDFGAPNPILALCRAVHAFSGVKVPSAPKTTFNIGVIRGGSSVNSIPESAAMRVDIRSSSASEMEKLQAALRDAVDEALLNETRAAEARVQGSKRWPALGAEMTIIGERPAGELDANSRLFRVVRAVDAQLGNVAQVQRASTDANIPLSLGREAVALGAGGAGGGAHTQQEWFDTSGRDLGLRRILLAMLALAGEAE